jgi:hypothetical protein
MNQIKKGDIVVLNNLPDAAHFEVIEVDGFVVEIREAGTSYISQFTDVSLIYKVVE